jgi:hypothetical protein
MCFVNYKIHHLLNNLQFNKNRFFPSFSSNPQFAHLIVELFIDHDMYIFTVYNHTLHNITSSNQYCIYLHTLSFVVMYRAGLRSSRAPGSLLFGALWTSIRAKNNFKRRRRRIFWGKWLDSKIFVKRKPRKWRRRRNFEHQQKIIIKDPQIRAPLRAGPRAAALPALRLIWAW